jgi:Tol biopolymer transport system component
VRALQRAEGKTLKELIEGSSSTPENQHVISEIRLQSYPNPFNPSTTIRYSLRTDGFVTLKVYDLSGRVVRTLVNRNEVAGDYSVTLDGTNLSSGVYFVRLEVGELVQMIKISLLK